MNQNYICEDGTVVNLNDIKKIYKGQLCSLLLGEKDVWCVDVPGFFCNKRKYISKNDYYNLLELLRYDPK